MIRIAAALILVASTLALAEEPTPVEFGYVDVIVDSGALPLAAYQVDITADAGKAKIVGVEGGASAAFAAAPYFDPAATGGSRIVIAAFSTARELPAGATRVARIHLQFVAGARHTLSAKLIAAGTVGGKRITATVVLHEQGAPK